MSVIFAVSSAAFVFSGAAVRKMNGYAEADTSFEYDYLKNLISVLHHSPHSQLNVSLDSTTVILPLYGFLSIVLGFCLPGLFQ